MEEEITQLKAYEQHAYQHDGYGLCVICKKNGEARVHFQVYQIDIDREQWELLTAEQRSEFQTALFSVISRLTADFGATVNFDDPFHWRIEIRDTENAGFSDHKRFARHLNWASSIVDSWPEWKRNILGRAVSES